jgi:hypothetical protein
VDFFVGSYQPEDGNGVDANSVPFLIIEAAPDSAQPKSSDIGTLVYIQASGGTQLAIRTESGNFVALTPEAGSVFGCYPTIPSTPNLMPVMVTAAQPGGSAVLEVALLRGAPGDAATVVDNAGDGEAATTSPASNGAPCGPGLTVLLEAAAIISDGRVVILDGGVVDAGTPPGSAASTADGQADGSSSDGAANTIADASGGG